MTDAPMVSRERLTQLITFHDKDGASLRLVEEDAEDCVACLRELLALRTPAQEAGQQPAEPVSKSVAKRIAAQKGEPYPFTAEPVCETCRGRGWVYLSEPSDEFGTGGEPITSACPECATTLRNLAARK
jgi:hypothetical protein